MGCEKKFTCFLILTKLVRFGANREPSSIDFWKLLLKLLHIGLCEHMWSSKELFLSSFFSPLRNLKNTQVCILKIGWDLTTTSFYFFIRDYTKCLIQINISYFNFSSSKIFLSAVIFHIFSIKHFLS
jgi:hypothetical protein